MIIIYDIIQPNMSRIRIVDASSSTLHSALVLSQCSEKFPNWTFEKLSQQTFDNELTRWLRKFHQASRGHYAAETATVSG